MNNQDDLIWEVMNAKSKSTGCSYLRRTKVDKFCRHWANLTGLCSRGTCPLANSRYATTVEKDGKLYLYMKTPERVHTPSKWWERVLLPRNYQQAIAKIEEELALWYPRHIRERAKQRYTKQFQMLKRMRKLEQEVQPKLVARRTRKDKVLDRKEVKALAAARLEKSIEKELLERLQSGTYGDMYNDMRHEVFLRAIESIEEVEQEEEEEENLREWVEEDLGEEEDDADLEENPLEYEVEEEDEEEEPRARVVSRARRRHIDMAYEDEGEAGRAAPSSRSRAFPAAAAGSVGDASKKFKFNPEKFS